MTVINTSFLQNLTATANAAAIPDGNSKQAIFNTFAQFTGCISEKKNTKGDSAKDLVVAMPMFNLLEYSDKNPKASGMLWKCC